MESGLFVLGLLAIAALIGGLMNFFSMFSKGAEKTKISNLEQELKQLNQRFQVVEEYLKNEQPNSVPEPTARASTATLATAPTATQTITPEENASFHLGQAEDTFLAETFAKSPENPAVEKLAETLSTITAQPVHNATPATPVTPNWLERGVDYAKNWLFGGNTLVRSGIVILFIGIAFLLKFAVDNNFIPIELRLSAVVLLGIALLAVGWRLRDKRAEYAWALQGGGIGVLYLTIFAAMKLYQLIPAGAAFALLIVVAFLSAAIAVLQSALPLAILGFTGGFLAPIFTSTGQGSHVGLFSYYLVLNLAIEYSMGQCNT